MACTKNADAADSTNRQTKQIFKAIASLLALITVGLFLACFGLGVAGIVAASNCDGNTLTQLITNCKRGHEERRLTAYYWMIGSTIAAIFFLPFATGLCYYIVELVIIYGNDDAEKAKKEEEKKLEEVRKKDPEANNKKKNGAATNGGLESTDGITTVDPEEKVKADDLEEYHFGDVQRAKFESLTKEALVLLFLALAFFMASFVGVLWMICIAYNFFNQATSKMWPFIVTEVVVGIVCPVFVFFGCILLAIVITFVTAEQLDLRYIIQRMLPSLKLEVKKASETADGHHDETIDSAQYWVIANHYSIKLNGNEQSGEKGELRHTMCKDASTWILATIAGLAVIQTVSNFINNTMVQGLIVPISEFLEESDICLDFACFSPGSFDYISVNCSNVNAANFSNINFLHCFRFFEFGKSTDFITNLAISVAFYLAVVHSFQIIFTVLNVLMYIRQSTVWGIIMIFASLLPFAGMVIYCISPYFAVVQVDAITAGQILLVSIYILLVGILLLTGRVHSLQPGSYSKETSKQEKSSSPDLGDVEAQKATVTSV